MAAGSDCRRFVSVRTATGGELVIPVEPLLLLFQLQDRGFTLTPDAGDIVVRPFSQLTPEDRRQLRRWKLHVLTLLELEAPVCA